MANISISSLHISVLSYAEKLERQGFTVITYKFESGRHIQLGPSYIELEVKKGDTFIVNVNILANGYGATCNYQISTADGWKKAKAEIQARIDERVAERVDDIQVTSEDFGKLQIESGDREKLLQGKWIDNDSVVVVTDSPEAETIDNVFTATLTDILPTDVAFEEFTHFKSEQFEYLAERVKLIQAQTFAVGDEVLYSPSHINFEPSNQNQFGVVSSVSGEYPAQRVWVKFNGPTGELTPVGRLIKKNTVFFEQLSTADAFHRSRFFLQWPADNVGESVSLRGLRGQVFNAVLEDHIKRAEKDGNACVNWKDRWF